MKYKLEYDELHMKVRDREDQRLSMTNCSHVREEEKLL